MNLTNSNNIHIHHDYNNSSQSKLKFGKVTIAWKVPKIKQNYNFFFNILTLPQRS